MANGLSYLRFRLRTLLLTMLVVGADLGLWFRPLTLTKHWPNGQMQYKLQVRRAWNGELITNGRQRWWWSNGQLAREGVSFDGPMARHSVMMPLENQRCWNMHGERIDDHPWAWAAVLEMAQSYSGPAPDPPTDWSIYRFAETEYP